ncbi:Hypothetical protein AA314_09709 [Archangium gephyra]|uniref:Uncharacterized protein n=1 Tax=Archangium gephyra TaxID=48 RepID=A0AAC8TJ88_9BACT|nr:Hypothetical protein AA314_09709 [Archangium gephyra]
MQPNQVKPLRGASGQSSLVSQGSREARGRQTVACVLARCGWGGVRGPSARAIAAALFL